MKLYTLPFGGKTCWVRMADAAAIAGISVEGLKGIASTIGAREGRHEGRLYVDFNKLAASASWKQLIRSAKAAKTQGKLF